MVDTLSYNNIYFSFTPEVREDFLDLLGLDIVSIAGGFMGYFDDRVDGPHDLDIEFSHAEGEFGMKFKVHPRT